MRLSRTDFVPLLAIVAGGAIGASLSFRLLERSRSDDVRIIAQPVPAPAVAPVAAARPLFRVVEVPRTGGGVTASAAHVVREQHYIEAAMDRLAGTEPDLQTRRLLDERKAALHDEIVALESEIVRLKAQGDTDDWDASRLAEAASTIDDENLKERVRYSRTLIGIRDHAYAREFEAETSRVVEELRKELESARLEPLPLRGVLFTRRPANRTP